MSFNPASVWHKLSLVHVGACKAVRRVSLMGGLTRWLMLDSAINNLVALILFFNSVSIHGHDFGVKMWLCRECAVTATLPV